MRKILRLATSCFLVLSLTCTLIISASAKYFVDVPVTIGQEYLDAINYISDNVIMAGTGSNIFSPYENTTRAMAVTVLYKLSGDTTTYTVSNFTDVRPSDYFYNAVGWARAHGIAAGTSATTFSPDDLVTREQLILMLYRFGENTGISCIIDENITLASDYTSVSDYARTALRWAYSYGILTQNNNTSAIGPQASVPRKDLALYMFRYRTNFEGLALNKPRFSFANAASKFQSGGRNYLMSADDWNLFSTTYAQSFSGSTSVAQRLTDIMNRNWGGSCYGMSLAVALDANGKIDFNGNYCQNAPTMSDIPSLRAPFNAKHYVTTDFRPSSTPVTKAESKINLLQNSWHIRSINQLASYIEGSRGLHELYNGQKHGGVGVLSYLMASGGHAINVYGKPEATSTGFKIKAYDNRYPTADAYVLIDTTNGTDWTGRLVVTSFETNYFTQCKYQGSFDHYEIIDFDGDYNNMPQAMATITAENAEILSEYTLLQVCATDDFVIENAEGETLYLTNSGVSGDMETIRQDFIPYGEEVPCVYLFVVPSSSSFSCSTQDDDSIVFFYALSSDYAVGTSAYSENTDEIHQVTLSGLSESPLVLVNELN